MAQLTTRTTSAPGATAKGSPLTNAEVDQNFNRLNKAGPQIRPSLLLDFANSESVDNRITFSRASAATYYDANGVLQTVRDNKPRIDFDPVTGECKGLLIEEQRTNYMRRSSSFVRLGSGLGWHADGANIVVAQHAAIAPDGTMSAAKVERQNNGGPFSNWAQFAQNWSVGSGVPNANAWTFSLWLKSATGSTITVTMSISGVSVTTTSQNVTVTTEWQRFSFSIPAGTIGAGSSDIGGGFNLSLGHAVFVWGGQMEIGSFATSHIPSNPAFTSRASSATYFDSTGVLRIAGTNQPRYGFGYDTASGKWVSQGLVLEAAATNILVDSDLYGNTLNHESIYTKTNNSTDVVAPNGSGLTTKLVSGTTGNTWYWRIPSAGTFTNGVTYTISVWVRCATGTTATWNLQPYPYSANTLCNVTDQWQRFSVTFTMTSETQPYIGFVSPMLSRTFYVWGWQAEVGSVATSYIPTFGSTATRAADVSSSAATTRSADTATMDFSRFSKPKGFSVVGEVEALGLQPGRVLALAPTASDTLNIYSVNFETSHFRTYQYANSALRFNTAGAGYIVNTFLKFALGVSGSAFSTVVNGYKESGTGAVEMQTDHLRIGSMNPGQYFLSGHIKRLAYYPQKLSDNELTAFTQ